MPSVPHAECSRDEGVFLKRLRKILLSAALALSVISTSLAWRENDYFYIKAANALSTTSTDTVSLESHQELAQRAEATTGMFFLMQICITGLLFAAIGFVLNERAGRDKSPASVDESEGEANV